MLTREAPSMSPVAGSAALFISPTTVEKSWASLKEAGSEGGLPASGVK